MGFSRQEYRSGLPFPSPKDLPNPGIEPRSSTLQAATLPSEPPGKPMESERDPPVEATVNGRTQTLTENVTQSRERAEKKHSTLFPLCFSGQMTRGSRAHVFQSLWANLLELKRKQNNRQRGEMGHG